MPDARGHIVMAGGEGSLSSPVFSPLAPSEPAPYTTSLVSGSSSMVAQNNLRQDVWQAAYSELRASNLSDEQADLLAARIVDRFTDDRENVSAGQLRVSLAVKRAIEVDVREGKLSIAAMRLKHGVGTSTVQRISDELRARASARLAHRPPARQRSRETA